MHKSMLEIDTSYWEIKDKQWKTEREAAWPKIEFMLSSYIWTKNNLNAIRSYYLRGKMPSWRALRNPSDPSSTHLDLFIFLWLHPSWDETLLKELRDHYIRSVFTTRQDIQKGIHHFFDSQCVIPICQYESMDDISYPYLEGRGELMFRVLVGNADDIEQDRTTYPFFTDTKPYTSPWFCLNEIVSMSQWLLIENMLPFNKEYLFRYDLPLEYWSRHAGRVDQCNTDFMDLGQQPHLERAFYRIYRFDTEKEGDTCRTRLVHKLRSMFDEREFVPEFKQMWLDVKAGKIEVENPWED